MESTRDTRCPHFQLFAEPLTGEGPTSYLAVRRCLLSERLVNLLRQRPDAAEFAARLIVQAEPDRGYAFVGPDLEAVTQQTCLVARCEARCTSSYEQILAAFGVRDERLDEVTCEENCAELPRTVSA